MKLVLGVIDIPYTEENMDRGKVPLPQKGKANHPVKSKPAHEEPSETTGEVAEKLEKKYKVMETFFDMHKEKITQQLHTSFANTIVNLEIGAPANGLPFETACEEIAQDFKHFLDIEEIAQAGIPGVPTQAALWGVNHRLKLEFGPRRPSFIDTGLYQDSMKAWIE